MKKVLVSAGVIASVALVTLLRILKPERFVNPELFANLTLFITELRAPSFILLPNRWLSESLVALVGKSPGSTALMFSGLLLLTAYVTTLFLLVIFRKYHYSGWAMLQEGDFIRTRQSPQTGMITPLRKEPVIIRAVQRLFFVVGKRNVTLMRKDFLYQIRDARNVHQLLIVVFLIGIYLFSIASLPLNWVGYGVQLKYVAAFLNLGLILIIVAALCSRLVYPAIVSEGRFLWLVKTSPVTPKHYLLTKFLFFFAPIVLAGQVLVIVSSLIIGSERAFIVLQALTAGLVSLSLVALALAFGISDVTGAGNAAERTEKGTGSTAYLLVSVFLVLFTLALEIAPVFLYYLKESTQSVFAEKGWMLIGGVAGILFLVNLSVTFFSLRRGARTIENLEGI
jgi:hypothetical protein